MRLQIDLEKRTIAYEGKVKVADLFNRLMAWFPEDWEQWSFVQYTPQLNGHFFISVPNPTHNNPNFNPFTNTPYFLTNAGSTAQQLSGTVTTLNTSTLGLGNFTTTAYVIDLEDK